MLTFHSFCSIALMLGLAALGGCNYSTRMEAYQTERFDLTASPAAAEGYPMEIVEGRFPTSDGKSKTTLWFSERVEVLPGEAPEELTLRLHGALDTQQTDLATVQTVIAKALQEAPTSAGDAIPTPHFKYEATYVMEVRTGLPLSVDLRVYARAGQLYNKEYTLTISRQ